MDNDNGWYRVIICGSREFKDYDWLKQMMNEYLSKVDGKMKIEIVSGGADGADKLGERYARENFYRTKIFIPNWLKLGKAAGPIRNSKMAEYADGCVAFWNRKSKGTADMIKKAYDKKLNVLIPAWFNSPPITSQNKR